MITDARTTPTHFVSLADWQRPEVDAVLKRAVELKRDYRERGAGRLLDGKSLAMIFHKPSLRTRVSFEVGMTQLGGRALYLSEQEIGMGSREPVRDVARVLSGYVDGIMIRTFSHALVRELSEHAPIPVINGLDDKLHPCQILSDLLTLQELGLAFDGLILAFVGDGNNVAHSWINAAALYEIDLRLAVPPGHEPDRELVDGARRRGARVTVTHDPGAAAAGAHVLYTDVWASMGQEAEAAARRQRFRPFQINQELLRRAAANAVVLHCLPAHRGEEITDDVIEGPHSRVFPQAENRLHAQKALLATLMG
jgi:ornithine carbamoyltransferase